MCCANNGRPSVPPSLLATALPLQTYDHVSDEKARRRAAYDLHWKVALGLELAGGAIWQEPLCEFRAQLLVHQDQAAVFCKSLKLARQRAISSGRRSSGSRWTRPVSVGARSCTPTTCWPTASCWWPACCRSRGSAEYEQPNVTHYPRGGLAPRIPRGPWPMPLPCQEPVQWFRRVAARRQHPTPRPAA